MGRTDCRSVNSDAHPSRHPIQSLRGGRLVAAGALLSLTSQTYWNRVGVRAGAVRNPGEPRPSSCGCPAREAEMTEPSGREYQFYLRDNRRLGRRIVLEDEERLLGLCQIQWPSGKWVYYTFDLVGSREISAEDAKPYAVEGSDLYASAIGPSGDHRPEQGPENDEWSLGWHERELYELLREMEEPEGRRQGAHFGRGATGCTNNRSADRAHRADL